MPSPGDVEKVMPLTPLQQGILLHTVAAPELGVYINQFVVELTGSLRAQVLRGCFDEVVQRHPALRAAFLWEGLDQQLQAIRPRVALPWTSLDWSDAPEAVRQLRLASYLDTDRATPFTLARAPLMRLALIRTAEDVSWLVWTHHHLLLDGWSVSRVFDEVFTRYRAARSGQQPALAVAPPYWEYLEWLQDQDFDGALRFWRDKLSGFTSATPLPGARTSPRGETSFQDIDAQLPPAVTEQLREFCRANRLTMGTVVHGAWALLLSRYTGSRDVVFGSVVSGRPPELSDVDEMVGMLSNTLPVRAQIDEDADAAGWLKALQDELAEARQYEYSPLAQVQACSDVPPGDALFDNYIVMENYPVRSGWLTDADELTVTDLRYQERPHYPLALTASATDRVSLRVQVDRRWYEPGAGERLTEHLLAILTALANEPHATVGALSLLTDAERQLVLKAWAEGGRGEPLADTMREAFLTQCARTPDATAVVHAGTELTYAQFAAQVHGLAARLREHGAGPEVRVGVYADRSIALLVAMYAVIVAEAVVVPIDRADPADRVEALLDTSGCQIVIVAGEATGRVRPTPGRPVVRMDDADVRDAIETHTGEVPSAGATGGNLVHVLHTSGSTGRPKGVMVTNRALLNHLGWMRREYPIGLGDRVIQRLSVAFDVSVWEIYWPLLTGACVLIPEADATDPERLAAEMATGKATVMSVVPSMLDGMLADPERRFPPGLRLLFSAGEVLAPRTVAALQDVCGATVINAYGPTEVTVACTSWPVPADEVPAVVPIGRPMDNVRGYVLDATLRPVPAGVPGELYIGGECLARGYSEQPGLTAERFVPDGFTGGGERMYRTGDRVRWLADGTLDYLGRTDFQVKIRGRRIEPGEVEAALCGLDEVRSAVVVARAGTPADAGYRLVAYLVPASERVPVGRMRELLAGRLPEYLLPAVFVWLDALPHTTSGKVDRAALPTPGGVRPELDGEFLLPATDNEQQLADIWATALGVDRVGVRDNFFELGGDSILMLSIVSRAMRAGMGITVRQFFDHPTVAGLAAAAEPLAKAVTIAAASPQADGPAEIPLHPVQHWFFDHRFAQPGHWNLGLSFAVGSRPETSVDDLAAALRAVAAAMVECHEALRSRFRQHGDKWIAEVLPAREVAVAEMVPVVSVTGRPDWEQALAEVSTAAGQFDLAHAPLLRMVIVDGGRADRIRLLLIGHHLVVDGVSWRVLLDDLHRGYAQARAGRPVQLPAASTPPGAWAGALRQLATDPEVLTAATFWRDQRVGGGSPLSPLPEAPALSQEADVAHVEVALDEDNTGKLLRDVPKVYRTHIDDALLTALLRALAAAGGRRDAVLALEGHGREQHLVAGADLARTVGWLTSIAPVRLSLPASDDMGTAIKMVKEQLRAVPHRGLSHGMLRYLHPQLGPDLAAAQPEISFNYLGRFDGGPQPDATQLALSPMPETTPVAHHPANHRPFLLEVNGITVGGRLRLTFSYGIRHHTQESVTTLAEATIVQLRALISHCTAVEYGGFTPSDFPESGLDQRQLDILHADLTQAG